MSDRLILKPQPPHHRKRFYALLGLGLIVIFGIWGLQLKLTFAKSAAERQSSSQLVETLTQLQQATKVESEVKTESVEQLKALLTQALAEKTTAEATPEVQTEAEMTATPTLPVAEQEATPVVAGEQIETQ